MCLLVTVWLLVYSSPIFLKSIAVDFFKNDGWRPCEGTGNCTKLAKPMVWCTFLYSTIVAPACSERTDVVYVAESVQLQMSALPLGKYCTVQKCTCWEYYISYMLNITTVICLQNSPLWKITVVERRPLLDYHIINQLLFSQSWRLPAEDCRPVKSETLVVRDWS